MTGVIVRSSANVEAGAKTRRSAILHGIWLLIFVAVLGTLLRMIPTSVLAAILVYTGYRLCDVKKVRTLKQFGWGEVLIYFATVIVIVTEDLLIGVGVGLGLSMLKLVFSVGHLNASLKIVTESEYELKLVGAGTFLRIPDLATQLELVPAGSKVKFRLEELSFIDYACLNMLTTWGNQHVQTGGEVDVDWDALKEFARKGQRNGHDNQEQTT